MCRCVCTGVMCHQQMLYAQVCMHDMNNGQVVAMTTTSGQAHDWLTSESWERGLFTATSRLSERLWGSRMCWGGGRGEGLDTGEGGGGGEARGEAFGEGERDDLKVMLMYLMMDT